MCSSPSWERAARRRLLDLARARTVFVPAPVGGPVPDAHFVQHDTETPDVDRSVDIHSLARMAHINYVSDLRSQIVEGTGL